MTIKVVTVSKKWEKVGWKKVLNAMPVHKPELILAPEVCEQAIRNIAAQTGMKFIIRAQPDGSKHVWRVE